MTEFSILQNQAAHVCLALNSMKWNARIILNWWTVLQNARIVLLAFRTL